jgi:hypothetical protein
MTEVGLKLVNRGSGPIHRVLSSWLMKMERVLLRSTNERVLQSGMKDKFSQGCAFMLPTVKFFMLKDDSLANHNRHAGPHPKKSTPSPVVAPPFNMGTTWLGCMKEGHFTICAALA